MKIYNEAVIDGNQIVLDWNVYKLTKGKHSLWIPEIEYKIPWTFNGKIEAFKDWEKGRNAEYIRNFTFNDKNYSFDNKTIVSLLNEYTIFQELAKYDMAPPIKDIFYIKNVISDFFPGTYYCDVRGVYGYFMPNVKTLEKGKWDFDKFIELFYDKMIWSQWTLDRTDREKGKFGGALGDLKKANNVVNGYLIDIRRTIWDTMVLKNLDETKVKEFVYMENVEELKEMIEKLSQFPHKQRKINYQSYFLNGEYIPGSRDTLSRMDVMKIPEDMSGLSVLDLGCNLGAICCESYRRGARKITGTDNEKDYIDCARALARHNGYSINYIVSDMMDTKTSSDYINSYYKEPIDIIFALSLYKHVKGKLFELLNKLSWKVAYVESNNSPEGIKTKHVMEMIEFMDQYNMKYEIIGKDTTRSPRIIFKVTK